MVKNFLVLLLGGIGVGCFEIGHKHNKHVDHFAATKKTLCFEDENSWNNLDISQKRVNLFNYFFDFYSKNPKEMKGLYYDYFEEYSKKGILTEEKIEKSFNDMSVDGVNTYKSRILEDHTDKKWNYYPWVFVPMGGIGVLWLLDYLKGKR